MGFAFISFRLGENRSAALLTKWNGPPFSCAADLEALPNILQKKYALLRDLDKSLEGTVNHHLLGHILF